MELNMNKYVYEVVENGYYEETENWQEAIDLFNAAGPLSKQDSRVRINVYRFVEEDSERRTKLARIGVANFSRYLHTTLRTHSDIHIWSDTLLKERKPMSFEYEEAAQREAEEAPCTRDADGEIVNSRSAQVILDEIKCLEEESADALSDEVQGLYAQLNKIYDEDGLYPCSENVCFCDDEKCIKEDEEAIKTNFHGDFSGMSDEVKDSIINPKHYKIFAPEDYVSYPDGIEYMDLCDKALAHLSGVESHLVGQILKYTLRVGKKDAMEQDATKIQWYANRLVETVKGK